MAYFFHELLQWLASFVCTCDKHSILILFLPIYNAKMLNVSSVIHFWVQYENVLKY